LRAGGTLAKSMAADLTRRAVLAMMKTNFIATFGAG
jgi:hypothetical protein